MNTLSKYCSACCLGLCLAISLSSCSPSGGDAGIKLKAAPTDAQLRSGKLAFTFVTIGQQPGRVLLPGWQAEKIDSPTSSSGPTTKITTNPNFCAIGIPINAASPQQEMIFVWYNATFTYYPPREASAQTPGAKYDVWLSVNSVANTPDTTNNAKPIDAQYYFYFGSLWHEGDYSSTDANAGGPGVCTGRYTLTAPWQNTNQSKPQ